jgi:site-specific DNA-methyltransferase (adenine-specific)
MIEINKNYNENCIDTMSKMPNNFIDLVVTSPPYDKLRNYNGYTFDFEKIAVELYRVLKDGGVIVWVVGDQTLKGSETGSSFKQALYFKEVGFNLHDTMIYKKKNPIPLTHNRYEQSFEYMFILTKGRPKTFNPILEKCSTVGTYCKRSTKVKEAAMRYNNMIIAKESKIKINVWEYSIGGGETGNHPAPFPNQLANDHIISWSNIDDLVYDPFMGSGTTAKMSILNNRNWIGSEISKDYCDIIESRVKGNIINSNFKKDNNINVTNFGF